MEGHIFQPMTEWLIATGGGWNVKRGRVPEEEKQIRHASKVLEECNTRVMKKVMSRCRAEERREAKAGGGDKNAEEKRKMMMDEAKAMTTAKIVRETRIRMEWRNWVQQFEDCPTEEAMMEVKKVTKRLVNCPVDKYGTEAMMM